MANPTLTQVRTALANQISAKITGLRTTDTVPSTINPPVAVVGPSTGTFALYEVTMPPNQYTINWTLRIYVIVSRAEQAGAQKKLDAYITPSGALSIPAAINADPTLGGVVDFAEPVRLQRYGLVTYNGVDYLGAEIIVEASG